MRRTGDMFMWTAAAGWCVTARLIEVPILGMLNGVVVTSERSDIWAVGGGFPIDLIDIVCNECLKLYNRGVTDAPTK